MDASEHVKPADAVGSSEGLGLAPKRDVLTRVRRFRELLENGRSVDGWVGAALLAEVEAEIERLRAPGVVYAPCVGHSRMSYSMDAQVVYTQPLKRICPICSGEAKNVRPYDDGGSVPFVF